MIDALALRLLPGDDLRAALERHLAEHGGAAAFVVAGIGSLSEARVRFAGAPEAEPIAGDLEILTLSGTLGAGGSHLHVSLADAQGRVRGGHVAPGCIVRTTAEVLLARLPGWTFAREHDAATGFAELLVRRLE
jgi:predicted DNA-binding protein with PD1-like motif